MNTSPNRPLAERADYSWPILSLRGVSKTYPGGVVGLHPTDLAVESGDRLVLLGPSGSGKSTLLRLVAGLEEADGGEIHISGSRADRLPPHRRDIAFLPQRPALYPHLTVRENLDLAIHREPKTSADHVELLRLGPLLDRKPPQLSGGEKQRVALAKLLVRQAGVWLLDEPFSTLDPVFRSEFRHDLHLLLDRAGSTIVLVTHDPADAMALGRRIGVLGEGRVQQIGTPDELRSRPNNRFVAFCLGQWNLIDGVVSGHAGGGESSGRLFVAEDGLVSIPLPLGLGSDPPHNLTLGIRPEDVSWRPPDTPSRDHPGADLKGWPVVTAEPVGSGWQLTLRRGRTAVRAGRSSGSPPPVGASADLHLPADKCIWFDRLTGRRIGE